MAQIADRSLKNNSPYSAVITREHFLFYEMRTTAKLLSEGYSEEETASKIVEDNLFQYPTEKTVRRMALSCIRRLKAMEDASLITAIANQPSDVAKQVCLYAMMKQHRLVWDVMITVIGPKFESFDMSYSKSDLNVFMMRLQEQDDWVATWSENTITKIIADKTSENAQERIFRRNFNLRSQKYSNRETYYLVIEDESGLQAPIREEFQIDIAFAVDEFNFF